MLLQDPTVVRVQTAITVVEDHLEEAADPIVAAEDLLVVAAEEDNYF